LSADFDEFVYGFSAAAKAVTALKDMKIGIIGKLPGMGDVMTDDMAVFRILGPEFIYDSIGSVQRHTAAVTDTEIAAEIEHDRVIFDVDPAITSEQHAYANRLYLGIKRYLAANGYSGYTIQFSELGEDGRFEQLPMLAASKLMADGYGYAAEGDATCAALIAAMRILCGETNFTEMYMMDIPRDAILFCHGGEGNPNVARKGKKPRLIDRPLSEGGLGNPPTTVFTPEPGIATVLSLVHCGGDSFKLVAAHGHVLEKDDLRRIEMPYMFFRPDSGAQVCVTRWLEAGATHHEAVVFGDMRRRLAIFCRLLGVELVEI
jgi:L-arabinose isomerase